MSKVKLQKEELEKLYNVQYLSTFKISQLLNCSRQTVTNYLKLYNITLRSSSSSRIRYRIRNSFNGTLAQKAYIIGFRLGDLHVYKTNDLSESIIVRCHTTTATQVELIKSIFSKYGQVSVSKSIYGYNINCYLDLSFTFLLLKEDNIQNWIACSEELMLAFIAGYIDAEGCFQINQGRGRFSLATYDQKILLLISQFLTSNDIINRYNLVTIKGTKSVDKYLFKKDVWRLTVNEKRSLFKFINIIKQYMQHGKRISDMEKVSRNIILRMK